MYKAPTLDRKKQIKDSPSLYMPDEATKAVIGDVLKDYQHGTLLMNKTWREFNDRSLRDEMTLNQQAFNSYVPPRSEDPDESWRAQTVRPITRNKLITIAAHITANILYPNVFAQNPNDEEDKDAAMVMRDLIEWTMENSNYPRQFLQAVITALVDPAAILHAEFAEVMRTVKEMKEDGTYSTKEIVDEILSGFQTHIVPCNELLIANAYEPNIQKQRFLIRQKRVDYAEAKIVHGKEKNFTYVKPGYVCSYDHATATFYDVQDPSLEGYMVNEVIYYNRYLDLELTLINGILIGAKDQAMKRNDKKYPFAKSGYEPINNGQFFYYKSAANKIGSDQELVDNLYNMIMDGTFLALMPPMAIYGSEDIGSSVIIPGLNTAFADPNVRIDNLAPKSDLRAGLETIGMVERSISQSSQDDLSAGVAQGGDRTAREVLLLEQNARAAMGLFGKMIGFLVQDFGYLMVGDIVQHMTVAQTEGIVSPAGKLKFASFVLSDRIVDGKKVSKKIQFDNSMFEGEETNEQELLARQFELLAAEGSLDSKMRIYKVNPELFRNLKYKITVDVDQLKPKSEAIEQAILLEAYDRMITNPYVDGESVTRDFLVNTFSKGQSDKYIKKNLPQGGIPVNPADVNKGVNGNLTTQLTGSNSLGIAAGTPHV